ncbi:DUF4381 domain-containing protein [Noviherbaspirillum denitrificans]|uniref:DUF4381 domain-containing protein n=1 Tax=Noviherbaspirillum denitrificans TaxID=1968433 RepID=A0A254TJ76_9BURK|nr:DUF4381 domain-containing protein [Noviherbaspirillum denitrificans]OWW22681.1 hypothetical protein AYR66_27445 [Noviherbaspirillum denitrificans]
MNPQALDALRDIHLPPEPAWWAMPEVWVLASVVIAVAAWLLFRRVRYRRLRHALRALSVLEAAHARDNDAVHLARGLSQLLRRYAAGCFPQAGVEGLTGSAWLAFLDAHGGGNTFTAGAGTVLESLPYRASGSADTRALVEAVRQWLRENPR